MANDEPAKASPESHLRALKIDDAGTAEEGGINDGGDATTRSELTNMSSSRTGPDDASKQMLLKRSSLTKAKFQKQLLNQQQIIKDDNSDSPTVKFPNKLDLETGPPSASPPPVPPILQSSGPNMARRDSHYRGGGRPGGGATTIRRSSMSRRQSTSKQGGPGGHLSVSFKNKHDAATADLLYDTVPMPNQARFCCDMSLEARHAILQGYEDRLRQLIHKVCDEDTEREVNEENHDAEDEKKTKREIGVLPETDENGAEATGTLGHASSHEQHSRQSWKLSLNRDTVAKLMIKEEKELKKQEKVRKHEHKIGVVPSGSGTDAAAAAGRTSQKRMSTDDAETNSYTPSNAHRRSIMFETDSIKSSHRNDSIAGAGATATGGTTPVYHYHTPTRVSMVLGNGAPSDDWNHFNQKLHRKASLQMSRHIQIGQAILDMIKLKSQQHQQEDSTIENNESKQNAHHITQTNNYYRKLQQHSDLNVAQCFNWWSQFWKSYFADAVDA